MAKRRAKRAKKSKRARYPVQRILRFDLTHTAGDPSPLGYYEDFHYLDISKMLSEVNSRLYRQGMMYHVANISIHDTNADCWAKFCVLPNTWPVRNAWKVGFQQWLQMNAQLDKGLLQTALKAGRWVDYRIFFNKDHISDTDKCRFTDVEGGLVREGEHTYSEYVSTDGGTADTFTAHMMGEHVGAPGGYSSVCLLEAYEEILIQPTYSIEEPDFSTGVWNNLREKAGEFDDIADHLSDDYDAPPYDASVFPGMKDGSVNNAIAPWCARETHITSAQAPMAIVGGFEVPLGLIVIETGTKADADNIIGIQMELVPGPYKGVMAEPMGKPRRVSAKDWRVS